MVSKSAGINAFHGDSSAALLDTDVLQMAVVYHKIETQAQQLNWALNNVRLKRRWVLRLDADERLTENLGAEVINWLNNASRCICGYFIKRRVDFLGRWIRHGGYCPT